MAMASASLAKSSMWGSRVSMVAAPAIQVVKAPLLVQAKRQIEGKVVSAMRDKTVAVEITRLVPDPKYKKRVRHSKKLHAHDPENTCKLGDVVTLAMCRPISKTKHYIVVEIKDKTRRRGPAKSALPPLESADATVEEKIEIEEKPAEVAA